MGGGGAFVQRTSWAPKYRTLGKNSSKFEEGWECYCIVNIGKHNLTEAIAENNVCCSNSKKVGPTDTY